MWDFSGLPSDTDFVSVAKYAESNANLNSQAFVARIGAVLLSALFFEIMYRAVRYWNLGQSPTINCANYNSRVVSFVHALIVSYLSLDVLFPTLLFTPFHPVFTAFGSTPAIDSRLALTCGYLVYDLLLCLREPALRDFATFFHHIVVISAFMTGLLTRAGVFYMYCFLPNEISTIFLNLNYFFAAHIKNLDDSLIYKVNGAFFGLSFLIFRVIQNNIVVLHMFMSSWMPLYPAVPLMSTRLQILLYFISFLSIAHLLLNLFWAVPVFRAVIRKCKRSSNKPNPPSSTASSSASSSTITAPTTTILPTPRSSSPGQHRAIRRRARSNSNT